MLTLIVISHEISYLYIFPGRGNDLPRFPALSAYPSYQDRIVVIRYITWTIACQYLFWAKQRKKMMRIHQTSNRPILINYSQLMMIKVDGLPCIGFPLNTKGKFNFVRKKKRIHIEWVLGQIFKLYYVRFKQNRKGYSGFCCPWRQENFNCLQDY